MSWNGSGTSGNAKKSDGKRPPKKSTGIGRGLLAGLLVVALAVLATWLILSRREDAPLTTKEPVRKAFAETVAPRPAAPASEPVATNAVAEPPRRVLKTYVDERGIERYEGGLRVVKHWPKPPADQMNTNKHLFKHSAELEIQWLQEVEPGEFMLDIPYDERFDRSLVQSFAEKIEFLPEDTPEERQTKENVIAAKAELKAAMERGEKPHELMNEARSELLRLYRYRDNLEQEIRSKRDSGEMSAADVKDYIDAANTLLERNGVKPIRMNPVSMRILLQQMRGQRQ